MICWKLLSTNARGCTCAQRSSAGLSEAACQLRCDLNIVFAMSTGRAVFCYSVEFRQPDHVQVPNLLDSQHMCRLLPLQGVANVLHPARDIRTVQHLISAHRSWRGIPAKCDRRPPTQSSALAVGQLPASGFELTASRRTAASLASACNMRGQPGQRGSSGSPSRDYQSDGTAQHSQCRPIARTLPLF